MTRTRLDRRQLHFAASYLATAEEVEPSVGEHWKDELLGATQDTS